MKRWRTYGMALAGALLLAPASMGAQADNVLVRAEKIGRGILRARGDECFVITAGHVVEGALPRIEIVGAAGVSGTAALVRTFPPDLAILRIARGSEIRCEEWLPLGELPERIQSAPGAFVLRESGGGRSLVPVSVVGGDEEFIRAVASQATIPLMQGMSGGVLMLNGVAAGLLLSVDSVGVARVLQLDDVVRLTAPFFSEGATQRRAANPVDLDAAQSILTRAATARDGSSQGQREALQLLLANGATFDGVEWNGVALRGVRIANGRFTNAKLHGVDLTDATASGADLSNSGLRFALLDRAKLDSAKLVSVFAPFVTARSADFSGADLSGANFLGADLRGADFRHARLRGAAFALADLRGARFDGADLTNADLFAALLDSASFADAIIVNTGMQAVTSTSFSLTKPQRAAACRYNVSRLNPDGSAQWHIRVFEQSRNGRSSGGFEYRDLLDLRGMFPSAASSSLSRCRAHADSAAGHDTRFPVEVALRLDEDWLGKAGREAIVVRRVRAQLGLIEGLRAPTRLLYGDSVEWRAWDAHLRTAARKTKPVGKPYASADLILLRLLKDGFVYPDSVRWDLLAQYESAFENAMRDDSVKGNAAVPLFEPLFPHASWDDLPRSKDQLQSMYREWTLARVAAAPDRLIVRESFVDVGTREGATTDLPLVTTFGVLRTAQPDAMERAVLESEGWTAERLTTAPLQGVDVALQAVYFAWPHQLDRFRIDVPTSVLNNPGMTLEFDTRVQRIQRVTREGRRPTVLLHVEPQTARLIRDGKVVWSGAVRVAPQS